MDKKKIIGCLLLLSLTALTAGCWDRRELQERNFVLAVGIDKVDNSKPVETFVQPHGEKRYRLSLQLLKPVSGGEAKDKSKTYVISNTGESMPTTATSPKRLAPGSLAM